MGSKSDYLEQAVLDHVFGRAAFVAPATLYLALFTTTPAEDGTGGVEVDTADWTNYARVAITNDNTKWGRTGSVVSNLADIDFGAAVIAGANPDIVGFALFDAATGGNQTHQGDLAAPKTIQNGDPVKVPAGSLTVTED